MPLWERGCQPFSLSDVPMLDGDMRHIAVMALLSDWMEHRSYDPDALIPTLRPYLDSLSSISEEELGRPAQCFHGYQKALDLDLPGFFLFDVMLWNIQHIARGQIFQALLRDGWNPEALLLHGIAMRPLQYQWLNARAQGGNLPGEIRTWHGVLAQACYHRMVAERWRPRCDVLHDLVLDVVCAEHHDPAYVQFLFSTLDLRWGGQSLWNYADGRPYTPAYACLLDYWVAATRPQHVQWFHLRHPHLARESQTLEHLQFGSRRIDGYRLLQDAWRRDVQKFTDVVSITELEIPGDAATRWF